MNYKIAMSNIRLTSPLAIPSKHFISTPQYEWAKTAFNTVGGSLWYFMKSHLRRSSAVIVANTICMRMFFPISRPSPVSLWWWLIRMSHLGWQCYFCVCSCLWEALSVVFVLSAAWGSKRERWRGGKGVECLSRCAFMGLLRVGWGLGVQSRSR